ncbi:hypothetical protein [Laceyella putida]|uniref:Uncharacterized protein n=1 Tax=Laceyella putida TaxID=110101 RepID=A0ABW2RKF4_9BACL
MFFSKKSEEDASNAIQDIFYMSKEEWEDKWGSKAEEKEDDNSAYAWNK